ncbi:MAG: carbohydrate kinase [Pirellulales bacterium]
MSSAATARSLTIVGLGESLFDCFPDQAIMGGAPLNLAVHADQILRPLGGRGVVATSVGRDDLGQQILDELHDRNMEVSHVQVDGVHPTGTVRVTVDDNGNAAYVFAPNVAWDHLTLTPGWQALASTCDAVCFGTLAQRSPESRLAIEKYLEHAPQALRLFDVNLRLDFYSSEIIERSLQLASAVKLNDGELPEVAKALGLQNLEGDEDTLAQQIIERFNLDWLALTRGPLGTVIYAKGAMYVGETFRFPPADRADTVGAGDACGAGLVVGFLLGWPMQHTVNLANRLGAYLASQPGATPTLPRELLP